MFQIIQSVPRDLLDEAENYWICKMKKEYDPVELGQLSCNRAGSLNTKRQVAKEIDEKLFAKAGFIKYPQLLWVKKSWRFYFFYILSFIFYIYFFIIILAKTLILINYSYFLHFNAFYLLFSLKTANDYDWLTRKGSYVLPSLTFPHLSLGSYKIH